MEEVRAAWVGVDYDAAAPAQLAIQKHVAEHRAGVVRVAWNKPMDTCA